MKTTLLFLAAAATIAFASSPRVFAQSFTLSITPAETVVAVGDSAVFSVQIQPEGGFDATVFLTMEITYPNGSKSPTTSFGAVNLPYPAVTFTRRPQSTTDTGVYKITITGENGQLKSTAQCVLRVSNNPEWKWKVVTADAGRWGNRIIHGNGGAVVGIEQLGGSTIRLNSFDNGEWSSQTYSAPGFEDSHGFAKYKLDKEGTLWSNNYGSVYRFKNDLTTVWSAQTGLNVYGNPIDFVLDNTGRPILKTRDDSNNIVIHRFADGQWHEMYRTYNAEESKLDEMPKICVDSAGIIWTSVATNTQKGILRLDDTRAEIFSKQTFDNDSVFRGIFCDRQGKVWCIHASKSGYASVFDGSSWNRIEFPSNVYLSAIEVDSKNNIWVGSVGKLFRYDGTQWTEYNSTNAPLNGIITGLIADKNDNIWIAFGLNGSHAGVIFNPNGLKGIPIVLSAEEPEATPDLLLRITPNPAGEQFTVHCPDNAAVTVRDVFGQVMYSGTGGVVSTSGWTAGVYFIEVSGADGLYVGGMVAVAK